MRKTVGEEGKDESGKIRSSIASQPPNLACIGREGRDGAIDCEHSRRTKFGDADATEGLGHGGEETFANREGHC